MIHYHGGPITPVKVAVEVWTGKHAFVSYAHSDQLQVAAEVAQSFALDNGAFSFWKTGKQTDWEAYYEWVGVWKRHPGCDFALIPDCIAGTEEDNRLLLEQWPHGTFGVPVWHLHESLDYLDMLVSNWPRVALGSSGEWSTPGTKEWWFRMEQAMEVCTEGGRCRTKLHGLRMLNPKVFSRMPLASADSTNVARNIGIDKRWIGTYTPISKSTRAQILVERIEAHNAAAEWRICGI